MADGDLQVQTKNNLYSDNGFGDFVVIMAIHDRRNK